MADNFDDVLYEVWRHGGDVDRMDRDRIEDRLRDGADADDAAAEELRRQSRRAEDEQ